LKIVFYNNDQDATPYMEGHNTGIANHEGSTLVMSIGDLAQHMLAPLYDNIVRKPIPGIEKFSSTVDAKKASLAELTASV
jgi:hypothetical protein